MGKRNSNKYTQKGSTGKCENYRGLRALPAAYRLFTNTIKNKLNAHLEKEMEEEDCGFRKGRSCVESIFTAQRITEKRTEHNLPLLLLCIDYEQAHDNVNRDILCASHGRKNFQFTIKYNKMYL
jgi:uncharacterized protein (UPF0128 family)